MTSSVRAAQNPGPMLTRLSSLHVALALLAWLAQLCLPVAHATSMAAAGPDAMMWCGTSSSPTLSAKLTALPDEIRRILDPGADAGAVPADHLVECAQFCAGNAGPSLPQPVPVTVALRAAGLEAPTADPVPVRAASHGAPPPPRGPPARA